MMTTISIHFLVPATLRRNELEEEEEEEEEADEVSSKHTAAPLSEVSPSGHSKHAKEEVAACCGWYVPAAQS